MTDTKASFWAICERAFWGFSSSRVAAMFNRCATAHQVAQPHCPEQRFHLDPSGDMRHGWASTERDFIEFINGS
jgi:hypothetical protein